jgi:uncharacterized protein
MSTPGVPLNKGFEQPFIDAYGDLGFRLKGQRHEGSLLLVGERAERWELERVEDLDIPLLDALIQAVAGIRILVIGTGIRPVPLAPVLRARVEAAGIGLEVMNTGAACRTFNILRAEDRQVAAALIAVP